MGVKVVRPSGRKDWYIQVCTGGRRYLKHVGSRDAAYAAKKDLEAELAVGAFVPPKARGEEEELTFRAAVERWLKQHVTIKGKPSTQIYYKGLVNGYLLPAFGDRPLRGIERRDVKAAVAGWVARTTEEEGKRGLRSIPNALRALGAFFSWATEEELFSAANPAKNASKIFELPEPFRGDYLRPAEVPIYLEGLRKAAPRYHMVLRLMILGGLRAGEAIALGWEDIDFAGRYLSIWRSSWNGYVTTPKTDTSIRRVPLSPETIHLLQEYRRFTAALCLKRNRAMPETVFSNEAGGPMDISKIRRAHEAGLKAAGLRHIRLHDLRGTFAALTVSAGVPVYHVSRTLGHAGTEVTERKYADLAPGTTRELPARLERFILEESAERNANQMRTEGEPDGDTLEGKTVNALH